MIVRPQIQCLRVRVIISALLIAWLQVSAQFLPFPSTMPRVNDPNDSALLKTWQGIKRRNIDAYSTPFVHRPKSEQPGDAVSEGIGYGMLCALYCNDQTYFNRIWDAGEQYMWQGEYYHWRVDENGTVIGTGAATDAEEDIAVALIFADALVQKGAWRQHTSPKGVTYAQRAQGMINSIWSLMVEDGAFLRPGAEWGGKAFVNPGYFAPAFYRIFDEFEETDHPWKDVIDQCYQSIAASPGYANGLVPDWMKPTGEFAGDELGYNSYARGEFCYKDGIRILWRLATDYLWYLEPRARLFCAKAAAFIQTPARANFFQMDGSPVTESYTLGNNVTRPRSEHSHLTVAMWASCIMAAGGPEAAESWNDELLSYVEGNDYWGKTTDSAQEDTLHNEMYFDQFLAWFGASLLYGTFTNLWEDLNDPNPDRALAWKTVPVVEPFDINANNAPLVINGIFNKPVPWLVEIAHVDSSDATVFYSGKSDTLAAAWYGLSSEGSAMPQGTYKVYLTGRGLTKPETKEVWLGRALDLKQGNWIIIDDFRDDDLKPYIGNRWTSYLDSDEGKAGQSTIRFHRVEREDAAPVMRWAYRLDGSSSLGYNPYAALEWNCSTPSGNLDLSGLDTIVVTARSASRIEVSVQLVTTDITDWNYFEDSLAISTRMQEHKLSIRNFTQRWSGDRTLDLSKVKAIRFQVQDVDGTQNEIALGTMMFNGNLDHLYTSPPPYVRPAVTRRAMRKGREQLLFYTTVPGGIRFMVPQHCTGAPITISTMTGKLVCVLATSRTGETVWGAQDTNGSRISPGVYIASVEHKQGRLTVPIFIMRK